MCSTSLSSIETPVLARKGKHLSTTEDGSTMKELAARLAELETTNARMSEELLALRAAHITGDGQEQAQMPLTSSEASEKPKTGKKETTRRGLLRRVIGIAAAVVGAGALSKMGEGHAQAATLGP